MNWGAAHAGNLMDNATMHAFERKISQLALEVSNAIITDRQFAFTPEINRGHKQMGCISPKMSQATS